MSSDKYDRQTRLWGEGQYLISQGAIIVLGVDCSSLEILKNLVLSGIGHITLVDDKTVDYQDINENFFLTKEDYGKPISKVALEAILELNSDTKGNYEICSIIDFLMDKSFTFNKYDLIISSNNDNKINSIANSLAKENNLRFVAISNYGLISYMRLYESTHAGIQLKLTDKPVVDLRIPIMWKELCDYCEEFNLENQDEVKHANTPYVVLLYHARKIFKAKYDKPPKSSQDKEILKEILTKMSQNEDEDNYKEAINFNYYACENYANVITPILQDIFLNIRNTEDFLEKLKNSNNIMKGFFTVMKAMSLFYSKYATLPVVGSLTDMVSETDFYIKLKKIYEQKAKEDKLELSGIIKDLLTSVIPSELSEVIEKAIFNPDFCILDLCCKNWPQINYQTFELFESDLPDFTFIDVDEEKDKTNLIWYILIKSSELFYIKHRRYPGSTLNNDNNTLSYLQDKEDFIKEIDAYLNHNANKDKNLIAQSVSDIPQEAINEFIRNSNLKIIPVVSIAGSIAAQEIIKLLTYSFETVSNTVIFDGINVTISVFDMKQ